VIDTTDRIVSERKRATAEAAYRATNERMQLALTRAPCSVPSSGRFPRIA
jgi:hypothetical protein